MLSREDVAYITANFASLAGLCDRRKIELRDARELIEAGRLPRPSYVLDDGTEMVPPDYFQLYDAAGEGEIEDLFRRRLNAKASDLGCPCTDAQLKEEWEAYLSGDYGVCLREVTPEAICAKGVHMTAIEELLDRPSPHDRSWLRRLARHVDALDELERPFADFDRVRWGPVSRDRLITEVRKRLQAGGRLFESGTAHGPNRQ